MTEVEQARAHLKERQEALKLLRISPDRVYRRAEAECMVLAALSWLWDAQERAGLNRPKITVVLNPLQQDVALTCFPREDGESYADWHKRAFGKYATELLAMRRDNDRRLVYPQPRKSRSRSR